MITSPELFDRIDAGKILDVATSNGYFLEYLLQGVKSYEAAIGVDIKEAARAGFGETFKENTRVRFQVMDASKLDFTDDYFDTVSISHSLHHLAQPEDILCEMMRVLKPGGLFIINEMYQDGAQMVTQKTHVLMHHWFAAVDTLSGIVHRETYNRQQLIDFADKLGLKSQQVFDLVDLSDDPKAPEILTDYVPVIDRYMERAAGHAALQECGETMRQRLQTIGFHNASTLLVIARK
jgi:SAM-dependent methyltransferase